MHWEVRSTSVSEAIDNVTSKGIQFVRVGQPSFQGYRRDLDVADVHPLPVQEGLRKRRWPQLHVSLDVAGQFTRGGRQEASLASTLLEELIL